MVIAFSLLWYAFTEIYSPCAEEVQNEGKDKEKKNKKRKRNSSKIPASEVLGFLPIMRPRIVKNDFRRYYANMWCNVFNSCDYNLMMMHLDTYCSRDVLIAQHDIRTGT